MTAPSRRLLVRRVADMRAFATRQHVVLGTETRCDHRRLFARAAACVPHRSAHVPGTVRHCTPKVPPGRGYRGFAETAVKREVSLSKVATRGMSSDTSSVSNLAPGSGFGRAPLNPKRLTQDGNVLVDKHTLILGIESSCDDTGAAVVTGDGTVLGEAIAKQDEIHAKWGGVVPNLAREAHEDAIDSVVSQALANAGVDAKDLSAVAVTVGPGLSMCLRVGVVKAQQVCQENDIPIIPVHHMEAHALVARVRGEEEDSEDDSETSSSAPVSPTIAPFPFLALLVSGGHNQLLLARSVGEYTILGSALDDALGEAYDKTARLLGLDVGGGGGPALESLATNGDPKSYRFPVPLRKRKDCDFSYAGLKTAVRLAIERDLGKDSSDAFTKVQGGGETDEDDSSQESSEDTLYSPEEQTRRNQIKANIAASFQFAAIAHLEERTRRAVGWARETLMEPGNGANSQTEDEVDLTCIVVAGGVAANATVRERLLQVANEFNLPLITPQPKWCTDNGVMVAWAGLERFRLGLAEEAPTAAQIQEPKASDDDDTDRVPRRDVPLLPRWPLGVKDIRATGDVKSSKTARVAPPLQGVKR